MSERRIFPREPHSSPATLHQGDTEWSTRLLDLSLKGALVAKPDNWFIPDDLDLLLTFTLADSDTEMSMEVTLCHEEADQLGFLCHHIDIESVAHLKTEAMALASQCNLAVLSTYSQKLAGYPFGSVACYMLDKVQNPIFLLNDAAEHSRNLKMYNKLSMLILEQEQVAYPNEFGRLTLLGQAELIQRQEIADIARQYLGEFPKDRPHVESSNFHFWRFRVENARYLGGFDKAHWLEWLPTH